MPDFLRILRELYDGGVEFILVGGLAAVLQGAPTHTYDIDIVAARDDANLARLLAVLGQLDAIFRIQPSHRLKADLSHLRSPGHKNLVTRYGYLDVLGSIGDGLTYEEILPHAVLMDVGEGLQIRVLDLPTIIALKEELGGEKERAVLPILRRTLEEKRKLHQE